jgi:hypothetical protein
MKILGVTQRIFRKSDYPNFCLTSGTEMLSAFVPGIFEPKTSVEEALPEKTRKLTKTANIVFIAQTSRSKETNTKVLRGVNRWQSPPMAWLCATSRDVCHVL